MLDLYRYHNKPESLKVYDQDIPYIIYWEEYGNDGRFPEAEETIMNSVYKNDYLELFEEDD